MTRLTFFTCLIVLAVLSGCASRKSVRETVREAVDPTGAKRDEEIKSFEERRDDAQFTAALTRWQSGDAEGCREMLEELLERRPEHADARRLLADLLSEAGNLVEAEAHLRVLIDRHPENGPAHHALGMLLEETNRHAEALKHFDLAVEFDPANQLYRLCRHTAELNDPARRQEKHESQRQQAIEQIYAGAKREQPEPGESEEPEATANEPTTPAPIVTSSRRRSEGGTDAGRTSLRD